ncbi:phage tail sheath family protein [Lacrimispora algidixylanolytica]|uniref:Phage tail sheath protein n=1 Tax=Lacrimispora algidixylanolytica TaxID=94868 RepID=A0A419T6P6_9FIRM|nr:phage tail sheath family protein [Lacrimispora algidixylanolytica]RKD33089.1 phage tail sheath protein [Lacrimispora algidixylanolytica]
MAGGNWTSQNKKQPGVYINVKSSMEQAASVGDRGIVAICEPLSWGPEDEIMTIHTGDDFTPFIGYDLMNKKALFLREILKGTDHTKGPVKVLLYRPSTTGATKAYAALEPLTVTAKYNGTRGNDISISVIADPDDEGSFTVQTVVDGMIKHTQTGKVVADLKGNDWVVFSGTGKLVASAGIPLTGGSDGIVSSAAHSAFLKALEPHSFNIVIYDGSDRIVQAAYVAFIKRMRDNLGKKCQAVMAGAESNSDAVISVKNGVVLSDETTLTPEQTTWWVGGSEAGAKYSESLVYAQYPDAVNVSPRLNASEIDDALSKGQIVFFEEFGSVKIVSDNNTLTTYTPDKGEAFSLNQVIRTLDTVASDIYVNFSKNYIGKIQNNAPGRDLLKAWIVGYLNEIQANGGIQNFVADDVVVEAGEAINSVVITLAIQPVAAVEKIYITATLTD